MSFIDEMEQILNAEKTLTTNGAVAYKTSGAKLLDFNFAVSGLRKEAENKVADMFAKVFYEDPLTAVKYLFYLGDVREGQGERRTFRIGLKYLADAHPDIAKRIIPLVPEYTRWDNVLELLETEVADDTVEVIKKQLESDMANMKAEAPISLCGKWMPSESVSSKTTKTRAKLLMKKLGLSPRRYRKLLSALRKYLNVVEVKMCSNRWGEIDYEAVPSRANLIYNNAFLRNDEERRREYLAGLSTGETKINAAVLQPHEITYKYRGSRYDETLESLWKALPNLSLENTLVVRDGSGSMTWARCGDSGATPLDVATALAIYMAEHNSGEWKDKFVTFSSNPKIVNLSNCKTLKDKIDLSYRENDCSNTNIYKTMMLILNTAVKAKMSQEEMPGMIVICSDMQFDGRSHNLNQTLFEEISDEFLEHGYKMPKICFWNLAGRVNNTIPMQQNEMGLILCSSFSVQILKMFMSNKIDPLDVLMEQLNSERYVPVTEAVKDII